MSDRDTASNRYKATSSIRRHTPPRELSFISPSQSTHVSPSSLGIRPSSSRQSGLEGLSSLGVIVSSAFDDDRLSLSSSRSAPSGDPSFDLFRNLRSSNTLIQSLIDEARTLAVSDFSAFCFQFFDTKAKETVPDDLKKGNNRKSDEKESNFLFYSNKIKAKPEDVNISEIHKNWKHNYEKLESCHTYIQLGLNPSARPLQQQEIVKMKASPEIMHRILLSYDMMIDFWGFQRLQDQVSLIPHADSEDRFRSLNRNSHNFSRITRMLLSIGHFGLHQHKIALIVAVLRQILHGKLDQALRSCWDFWIPTIENEDDKAVLFDFMAACQLQAERPVVSSTKRRAATLSSTTTTRAGTTAPSTSTSTSTSTSKTVTTSKPPWVTSTTVARNTWRSKSESSSRNNNFDDDIIAEASSSPSQAYQQYQQQQQRVVDVAPQRISGRRVDIGDVDVDNNYGDVDVFDHATSQQTQTTATLRKKPATTTSTSSTRRPQSMFESSLATYTGSASLQSNTIYNNNNNSKIRFDHVDVDDDFDTRLATVPVSQFSCSDLELVCRHFHVQHISHYLHDHDIDGAAIMHCRSPSEIYAILGVSHTDYYIECVRLFTVIRSIAHFQQPQTITTDTNDGDNDEDIVASSPQSSMTEQDVQEWLDEPSTPHGLVMSSLFYRHHIDGKMILVYDPVLTALSLHTDACQLLQLQRAFRMTKKT